MYISQVSGKLVIHGTEIPGSLGDICSPEFEKMLKFYPEFLKSTRFRWSARAYLCALLKGLDQIKPNGREGQDILNHYVKYIGGLVLLNSLLNRLDFEAKARGLL